MDRRYPELKTEDVQLPPIFYMSYPVLKRVLQYVYGSSEGSAALQCRLVCRSFNEVMLRNVRLHLNYRIRREPNRCQVVLKGLTTGGDSFPTDQLINSSLIDRIFTMKVARWDNSDFFDEEEDLVSLASEFTRPVDVSLFSSHFLPLLPLAEMPQIRVIEVEKLPNQLDLTPPELNFLADLPHMSKLSMSYTNVQQLSQRADLLNISQLKINWEFSRVPNLDINFIEDFSHLQSLTFVNCQTAIINFRGISLPHVVKCELFLLILPSFTLASELLSTKRLLTSMRSAMPKLKDLNYSTKAVDRLSDVDQVTQLISAIFQFCPTTVEDLSLYGFHTNHRLLVHSQLQLKWLFRTLFSSTLNSNITRASFFSCFSPVLDARPFQFKKSRSGVQVGQPVEMMFNPPLHMYQLKRPNGQICQLAVICLDR